MSFAALTPDPAPLLWPPLPLSAGLKKRKNKKKGRYLSQDACFRLISCADCGAEVQVFKSAEPHNGNPDTLRLDKVLPGWHEEGCEHQAKRQNKSIGPHDSSPEPFEEVRPHGEMPPAFLSWFTQRGWQRSGRGWIQQGDGLGDDSASELHDEVDDSEEEAEEEN